MGQLRLVPPSPPVIPSPKFKAIGIGANVPGAKIMLCTDGLANTGIGKVTTGPKFYNEIAHKARANGTAVSVITMEGEDCKVGIQKNDVPDGVPWYSC